MRKLFLDDIRKAPDFTWDVVRCYEQFVAYVKLHGIPDMISFDHDLGIENGEEKTGYDCAKWLVENYGVPKQYFTHSFNPVGASNIKFALEAGARAR